MFKQKNRKAQSLTEWIALTALILVVFLSFQKYIVRGFSGQWKKAGDAWGQGRIYDPHMTTECAYVENTGFHGWYNRICFEERRALVWDVILPCYSPSEPACLPWVLTCQTDFCND